MFSIHAILRLGKRGGGGVRFHMGTLRERALENNEVFCFICIFIVVQDRFQLELQLEVQLELELESKLDDSGFPPVRSAHLKDMTKRNASIARQHENHHVSCLSWQLIWQFNLCGENAPYSPLPSPEGDWSRAGVVSLTSYYFNNERWCDVSRDG